jgi:hypothetical protein
MLAACVILALACYGCKNKIRIISGTFSEAGVEPANISVGLYELSATGDLADTPLGQTYTNRKGKFIFNLRKPIDPVAGHYVIVAYGSALKRNITGARKQDINLVTDTLSTYLSEALALGAPIDTMTTDAVSAMLEAASACSGQTTPEAVRDCFLASENFGAAYVAAFAMPAAAKELLPRPTPAAVDNNTSFSYDLDCNEPYPSAGSPTGFTFDIDTEGQISDGNNDNNSDAFDDAPLLRILAGDSFAGSQQFPELSEAALEGVDNDTIGDQLVFSATTDNGLKVTRSVYVPRSFDCTLDGSANYEACGWARYLDCFQNYNDSAQTISISYQGNLGSDGDEIFVGDAQITDNLSFNYYWATKDDDDTFGGGDPVVGVLIGGEAGMIRADSVSNGGEGFGCTWINQTIEAGEKACYLTYIALGDRVTPDGNMMTLLRYLFEESPRNGIALEDDAAIRNFEPRTSLTAPVGSVYPNAAVTVTNETTTKTAEAKADQYGAFKTNIECQSGETLSAVSDPGNVTVSVVCE